jgi:hypothetical protein
MGVPESFGRALDTSSEAFDLQVVRWRAMTAGEKLALVSGLSRATLELSDRGMRARYPNASPREIFLRLAILRLGRELAVEAYPEAADLAP